MWKIQGKIEIHRIAVRSLEIWFPVLTMSLEGPKPNLLIFHESWDIIKEKVACSVSFIKLIGAMHQLIVKHTTQ
jgi:hypothetical protein